MQMTKSPHFETNTSWVSHGKQAKLVNHEDAAEDGPAPEKACSENLVWWSWTTTIIFDAGLLITRDEGIHRRL